MTLKRVGDGRIVSLRDAVAELVHDGDTVALEGFTHLIPFAAGHEIIRQRRRDLTLVRMTPDLIYDQLIGAGCASELVFSWGGNPGVGSLHRFRDAVEHGWPRPLEIEEHSHAGMANRYVAGASGLPFAVLRGYVGTDLLGQTDTIAPITCPFTGEVLTAVPALRPDVTIIHAQRADRAGNVQLWGITGVQKEAVLAAQRSLVTVEEIVDGADPGTRRGRAAVLGGHPRGARRRAARTRPTRRATRTATTTSTRPGTRSAGTGTASRSGSRRTVQCTEPAYTADEMMTVAAARALRDGAVCFVGIGLPSTAANLARRTPRARASCWSTSPAPSAPSRTRCRCRSATASSPTPPTRWSACPEIFNYWLQPGRIDVGFLGAAQIDRFANINTTVIGGTTATRASGCPAPAARRRSPRPAARSSWSSGRARARSSTGSTSSPPSASAPAPATGSGSGCAAAARGWSITDLGVLEPDPDTCELTLTSLHPGVTVERARAATGWPLRVASSLAVGAPPSPAELAALRDLKARTGVTGRV